MSNLVLSRKYSSNHLHLSCFRHRTSHFRYLLGLFLGHRPQRIHFRRTCCTFRLKGKRMAARQWCSLSRIRPQIGYFRHRKPRSYRRRVCCCRKFARIWKSYWLRRLCISSLIPAHKWLSTHHSLYRIFPNRKGIGCRWRPISFAGRYLHLHTSICNEDSVPRHTDTLSRRYMYRCIHRR